LLRLARIVGDLKAVRGVAENQAQPVFRVQDVGEIAEFLVLLRVIVKGVCVAGWRLQARLFWS
jgi:hypothetical protein